MKKTGIFTIAMVLAIMAPNFAHATDAVTIITDQATVIETTPIAPAVSAPTAVVIDPSRNAPRDAITGEIVKPKEAAPKQESLRDHVRDKMIEDKAAEDAKLKAGH